MTFDRSKVVDALCDNLEQWIGWEGYFADLITNIKEFVENESYAMFFTCTQIGKGNLRPFECNLGNNNYDCAALFYPVNPPKEKTEKKLVPFDTCQELIDWYCEHEDLLLSKNNLPKIWACDLKSDVKHLITDYSSDEVFMAGSWYKLSELTSYTLLDGTPIGKEEE